MKTFFFVTALITLTSGVGFAETCPQSITVQAKAPQLADSQTNADLVNFLSLLSTKNLANTGEDMVSGCMYESSDKSVFADFGKGFLNVYPGDMYTKAEPELGSLTDISTAYVAFEYDSIPKLNISEAAARVRSVSGNASHAGATANIVSDDKVATLLSYKITLQLSGKKSIVLKK